ncbi:MAG: hypothetical protein WCI05_16960, partial [Myxococcales bacterium]
VLPRIEGDHWVGELRLSIYGSPLSLRTGVQCELVTSKQPRPVPVDAVTADGGSLSLKVPNSHPDCRVLSVRWHAGDREHAVQLPLPGAERWDAGLGVRVMTAPHEGSAPSAGAHVSSRADEVSPLRIKHPVGHRITLIASKDLDIASVTKLFPNRDPETMTLASVPRGQEIDVDLPNGCAYGFLCIGALSGDDFFEDAAPVFAPTEIGIRCEAPASARPGQTVVLTLRANKARPTPMAVVVRDARLHAGGGLEAAGAAARLATLQDEWNQTSEQHDVSQPLAGPGPGNFSDCYLHATFILESTRQEVSRPPSRGDLFSLLGDVLTNLEDRSPLHRNFGAGRGFLSVSRTAFKTQAYPPVIEPASPPKPATPPKAATHRASSNEVDSNGASRRLDTLFADVVMVNNGRKDISFALPSVPGLYTVDILALDVHNLGWSVHIRPSRRGRRSSFASTICRIASTPKTVCFARLD